MPKRRYQEGTFRTENGCYYSFFYRDRMMPDGSVRSVLTREKIGKVESISALAARREHNRIRNEVNRERGLVPTAPKGESFRDVAEAYVKDIAPNLSISTARQRASHLNAHILPRFGNFGLMAIDYKRLQCFVTELTQKLSRKTVLNILGTLFAVLAHAKRCSIRIPDISLSSHVGEGPGRIGDALY